MPRKYARGDLETDRYGAFVQIWRPEGWGIGHMMGLDYSTASQGREGLTQRLKSDRKLHGLMGG